MRSGLHNPIIPYGKSQGAAQGQFITLNTAAGLAMTVAAATATLTLADDLAAVEALSSTGIAARTGTSTWAVRTLTGTTDKITVTNGTGASGNPTITIASTYAGQTSITTLGTVATGVWNGTVIGVAYGGTSVTDTPTNGQLLIGNGSGYTLAAITAGTGVSVTNGSGTITLANTGVTSAVAGSGINVSGATGAVTISLTSNSLTVTAGTGLSGGGAVALGGSVTLNNAGVTSLTGTGDQVSVSGSTGSVTLSLPQDIATTSDVEFANLTISGYTSLGWVGVAGGVDISGSTPGFSLVGTGQTYVVGYNSTSNIFTIWDDTGGGTRLQIADTTGVITLPTNVASTSASTGSLVVAGGLGIGGNAFVGGKLNCSNGTMSANGTTQGAGTTMTKDLNVVTAATGGSAEAVKLPTGASGDKITVINATAVTVYVFPQNSCSIGALGTNAAFTLPAGCAMKFIGTSATMWYPLNAAYA